MTSNKPVIAAEHFFAVTRMFMGLPTVQLIKPRSL